MTADKAVGDVGFYCQVGKQCIGLEQDAVIPRLRCQVGHIAIPQIENAAVLPLKASNAAQMDAGRLQWIFRLFPAVEKFWNHPAGKLSGGQKQMVAVARAIIEPRDLLIVDEPSKGLAPAIINNMIEAFDQLKKSGVTILLVEQNIHFAKRLGDNVAVMDNGRVVHAGSMAALAADEALQQSLLGLSL